MIYNIQKELTLIGKTIIKPERSFSFNAYLLTGEMNVLIDTVPDKASEIFWREVEEIVPIEKLDALILNHSEEDHSGALPYLLHARPDIPIYCTAACAERLRKVYPDATNWKTVKQGDTLRLGENMVFQFYETPGLHWDDNMVTYFENDKILFSNDLFGQSIGLEVPVDSEIEATVLESATKAYFNKVFCDATNAQKQIISELVKLPIRTIAAGHGVIIRDKIKDMIKWYREISR